MPEPSADCFPRRELALHRIALHFSDVEVQTTNSPHRVAQSGTEGKSLIDTPFSRDPNISVRCPPEETSRSRVGNSGFQRASSNHSSAAPPNAHNPRSVSPFNLCLSLSHFSLSLLSQYFDSFLFQNDYDSTGSIRSRKHAPPPPIPFNQTQPPPIRSADSYSSDVRSKSNMNTGSNDWEVEDRINRNTGTVNRFDRYT